MSAATNQSESIEYIIESIEAVDYDLDLERIDHLEALQILKALAHECNHHPVLLIKLVEMYLAIGDFKKAVFYLDSFEKFDDSSYQFVILKSLYHHFQQDTATAQKLLHENQETSSEMANAYFEFICLHFKKIDFSRYQSAVSLMIQYTKPTVSKVSSWIWICMQAELFDDGLKLSHLLLKDKPDHWISYIGPAYFLEKLGRKTEAQTFFYKAESFKDFFADEFLHELKQKLIK